MVDDTDEYEAIRPFPVCNTDSIDYFAKDPKQLFAYRQGIIDILNHLRWEVRYGGKMVASPFNPELFFYPVLEPKELDERMDQFWEEAYQLLDNTFPEKDFEPIIKTLKPD